MIRLGLVGLAWDYGERAHGRDPVTQMFLEPLYHMPEIELCWYLYDEQIAQYGEAGMQEDFLHWVKQTQPDVTLVLLFKEEFYPETLAEVRRHTLLGSWGSDDHWRFRTGYMQERAPHFNFCVTTWPESIAEYSQVGQDNVIVSQWGANTHSYYPTAEPPLYDVSFVGMRYGERMLAARTLKAAGIPLEVFGRGWSNGYLTNEEMIEVYRRSQISLIFNNNIGRQYGLEYQNIKARNFEIPACGTLCVTGPARHVEDFYEPGEEIVVYSDYSDLVRKLRYYLEHDEERKQIAQAGYERTLAEHTMEQRFRDILGELGF